MNKYYIVIISLFSLFISCRKEINVSIPDLERRIVLNAIVHPDSVFSAKIFRSNHVKDNFNELLYLNNATVSVFENEELLEVLELDTLGYYRGKTVTAEAGRFYEFEASSPNLTTAKGSTEVIEIIPIISIDSLGRTKLNFDNTNGYYYSDSEYSIYSLNFIDNINTKDYYRVKVKAIPIIITSDEYPDEIYDGSYIESIDPAIEIWSNWDGYFYFSDKLFNGKEYSFEFGIPSSSSLTQTYNVFLEHVSEDFYRYVTSIDFQNQTKGMDLFFQAVQVYNNIEDGYGIIGNTSISKDSISFYGEEINKEEK